MRFKADEAAQTLTGPYRAKHPFDNLERQPVHEHDSIPLAMANAGSGTAANVIPLPSSAPASGFALQQSRQAAGANGGAR